MLGYRVAGWLVGSLVLGGGTLAAWAHEGHVRRQLQMERVDAKRFRVMVHLEVTGHRRATWRKLADNNNDGRLSPSERLMLRDILVDQALDGIELRVGHRRVALQDARRKLDLRGRRPLAVMVLGWIPVPAGTDRIQIRTARWTRPLNLVRPDGFSRQLAPGTQVEWSVGQPATDP